MSSTTVTITPGGACGARTRAAVCTLPAGHHGPHQAHGFGGRLVEEWLEPITTPDVDAAVAS